MTAEDRQLLKDVKGLLERLVGCLEPQPYQSEHYGSTEVNVPLRSAVCGFTILPGENHTCHQNFQRDQ